MVQRILVFEKNTDFLRELETGFGRYGAQVEVFHDADTSILSAKSNLPALVLLSVESMSAPGEAFLVCKKYKSDDALASVPFVIMGGAQHAESFESHKKLKKRRADEYLQLPIRFDDLLSRVSALVPFTLKKGAQDVSAELDEEDLALDSLEVDDDIEAFADNAFDDLVFDEPKATLPEMERPAPASVKAAPEPSKVAAPAPRVDSQPVSKAVPAAAPAASAGPSAEEFARVKGQIDQLNTRVKGADDRAKHAEDRAKTAEDKLRSAEERAKVAEAAPRASTSPTAPSVSSRDYLDLREQLNRKDKELLALRDEVTTRDRQLLDGSDRSLELERAQAELGDRVEQLARQLHDAQEKIRAYESDRDAIVKRTEDLRMRLLRSEDKSKKSEGELDTIKRTHAGELSDLKVAHAGKLEQIETTVSSEVARMRASHAAALEEAGETHAAAMKAAEAASRTAIANAMSVHANEMSAVQAAQEQALADAKADYETASTAVREAAEADKAAALSDAAAGHRAQLAARMSDAEQTKASALDGLRKELETAHGGEKKELEDRHGRELAVLGRKLSEADAKKALLNERVEVIEQARQEIESSLGERITALAADLGAVAEERDSARNELSAAQANIESLGRTQSSQSNRIAKLDAQLGLMEDRYKRADAKIAADAELLTRARRALGISLGLLDQQQQNAIEDN